MGAHFGPNYILYSYMGPLGSLIVGAWGLRFGVEGFGVRVVGLEFGVFGPTPTVHVPKREGFRSPNTEIEHDTKKLWLLGPDQVLSRSGSS